MPILYIILALILSSPCYAQGRPPERISAQRDPNEISLKEFQDLRFQRLREYIDVRFDLLIKARDEVRDSKLSALDALVHSKLIAMEKAVDVAKVGIDARLMLLNEFKGAMQDQSSKYITRAEFEVAKEVHNKLATAKELEFVRERQDMVLAQLKNFVPRDELMATQKGQDAEIRMLSDSRVKLEGAASNQSMMITLAISLLAVFMSGLGLILRFLKHEKEQGR